MATSTKKLESALAAIENMTDAEYLALYEEAKKCNGPEVVVPEEQPTVKVTHRPVAKTHVTNWADLQMRQYAQKNQVVVSESNQLLVA